MRLLIGAFLAVALAADAGLAQDPAPVAVKGRALLAGALPPKPKKVPMNSECQEHAPNARVETELVNAENRGIANVFVWVRKGAPKGPHPMPAKPAELRQKGCVYRPRVQGMRAGQDLAVINDDPLQHNVNFTPVKSNGGNKVQLAGQTDIWKLNAEVMVKFKCDIHPWMFAYVGVVEHPFFAVTDADGGFELPPLPAGDYELGAWHEVYGEQTLKVTVSKHMTSVEFSFTRPAR